MRTTARIGLGTLLIAAGLLAGCGKKAMDQPPPTSPTPAPADTPPPPPPPPPPPAETPRETAVELGDVFFDYDSAELRSDAQGTLTENGKQLMSSTGSRVQIEGHCDERGTVDYNLALGERRAAAAKDFLVTYGVGADRIETISYGENKPMAMGHDESAWSQNRRAHFVLQGR